MLYIFFVYSCSCSGVLTGLAIMIVFFCLLLFDHYQLFHISPILTCNTHYYHLQCNLPSCHYATQKKLAIFRRRRLILPNIVENAGVTPKNWLIFKRHHILQTVSVLQQCVVIHLINQKFTTFFFFL